MISRNESAVIPAAPVETEESVARTIWASVAATLLLTAICCGLYPGLVWGLAQVVFPHQAGGSLVKKDGSPAGDAKEAVGSALLAQGFSAPEYFLLAPRRRARATTPRARAARTSVP